jgi:two-component system, NtrC family, sensor kinase
VADLDTTPSGVTAPNELAEGVIVLDLDGIVREANPGAIALGAVLGARFEDRPGDHVRDGRIVETTITRSPQRSIVTLRDVTERCIARRRAELAERRAEFATAAGSIAHQINNPLAIVTVHAELMKDELITLRARHRDDAKRYGDIADSMEELELAIAAITKITAEMRAFAQPMPTATYELRRAIEWAIRAVAHDLRDRAFATTTFDLEGPVTLDEPRLGRLLVHLLRNAARAITPGASERNQVVVTTRPSSSHGRAIVEVRDTGAGLAAGRLARIFEPAITERDGHIHIGLGLSECRAIVESVGGTIALTSIVGTGTTVTVELPLRD